MGTTNTYSSLLPRKQQQSMRILKDLIPVLLFNSFGARDTLEQRSGKKGCFRIYYDLPAPLTPDASDADRAIGQQLTFADIWMNIVSFQSKVPLTKDQILFHEDDLVSISKDKIKRQLAQTDDIYMYRQVRAGTSVRYAGGVSTRGTVNSAITLADLDLAVRDLEGANVPRVAEMVPPSMNTATEPIPESYIAFCHPHLRGDLSRTDGWTPIEQYGQQKPLHPAEIGASKAGIRFIASTNIAPYAVSGASSTSFLSGGTAVSVAALCDVYPILIFGQDAFGHMDIKGVNAMEVNVIKPGSKEAKTVSDPNGKNGCVAAELYSGGGILDERRLVRLECAASATWA